MMDFNPLLPGLCHWAVNWRWNFWGRWFFSIGVFFWWKVGIETCWSLLDFLESSWGNGGRVCLERPAKALGNFHNDTLRTKYCTAIWTLHIHPLKLWALPLGVTLPSTTKSLEAQSNPTWPSLSKRLANNGAWDSVGILEVWTYLLISTSSRSLPQKIIMTTGWQASWKTSWSGDSRAATSELLLTLRLIGARSRESAATQNAKWTIDVVLMLYVCSILHIHFESLLILFCGWSE